MTSPSDIKTGKDKLEQKVIDFEKIQDYGLKQGKWDVVFITYVLFIYFSLRKGSVLDVLTCCFLNYSLGTTKSSAGSAEAFERIDRESVQLIERILFHRLICFYHRYVVNAAKEARNVELATQRVIYLSVIFFPTVTIQTHSQDLSQQSTGANSSSPILYPKSVLI